MTTRTTGLRAAILTVSLAIGLAACGGAAATPPASTGPTPIPPVTAPPPTAVPGSTDTTGIGTGDRSTDPASGGGTGGSTGGSTGGVVPPPPEPVPGGNGGDAVNPEPTFVTILEGLTDVHAVSAVNAAASVKGHHVTLQVEWWSGVEPCSALAGVLVEQDGADFTVTVNEGMAQRGVMCIELAVYKGFTVDLGELATGTYVINVFGIAAPITVEIPA